MAIDAGTAGFLGDSRDSIGRPSGVPTESPATTGWAPVVTPAPNLSRRQRRRAEDARRVGAALSMLREFGVRVLHDRSVPGTDGIIEHVVIGNHGITVVRSAGYVGRIRSTKSDLFVGGTNISLVVHGLQSRVVTVRHLVGGEAEVHGAFALTKRRRERLRFHGRIVLGSTQSIVDYIAEVHRTSELEIDIDAIADELDGIFLPAQMLS